MHIGFCTNVISTNWCILFIKVSSLEDLLELCLGMALLQSAKVLCLRLLFRYNRVKFFTASCLQSSVHHPLLMEISHRLLFYHTILGGAGLFAVDTVLLILIDVFL